PHPARDAAAARRREGAVLREILGERRLREADHVAVVRRGPLPEDDEGVERVAVARRVDLGLGDAEAQPLEAAADASEERLPVLRVDHDLQAFAEGREARLDDRRIGIDAVVKVARLPGDLLRVVAQEIRGVELLPEAVLDAVGERVEAKEPDGFLALFGERLVARERLAG